MDKKIPKVEVIKMKTSNKECYICKGTGYKAKYTECDICEGTGIFTDNHYILISNGIAFSMDTIK